MGGPQSSTPADTIAFNGVLNAGQSYTQTDSLQFPATVGQYVVRVVTDANQNVEELSYSNNTGVSSAVNDQASYQATVSTSVTTVPNGTPVPLSGVATLTSNGQPAADVPVAVYVMVDGTTRTLTATTNADGQYSVTFQPLAYEAGQYTVAAADPGVVNPPAQAQFQIVGMSATPAIANVKVVPDTPPDRSVHAHEPQRYGPERHNRDGQRRAGGADGAAYAPRHDRRLTGPRRWATALMSSRRRPPAGLSRSRLPVLTASAARYSLSVTVVPLTPELVANPGYLNSGMVVGSQSTLSFTVTNDGGAPAATCR